jgi:hypothetical protein
MLTRSLPLISPFGLPWQSPERLPSPPGCPPGPNCRLPPIHERAIAQVLSEPHRRLCTNRPSPDHQLPTDKAPCLPMILSSHPSSVLGRPAAFPMILSSMILSSHNPARNAPSSKKNHFAVNDFAPSAPFFISPPPSVLRPRPPRGPPRDSVFPPSPPRAPPHTTTQPRYPFPSIVRAARSARNPLIQKRHATVRFAQRVRFHRVDRFHKL